MIRIYATLASIVLAAGCGKKPEDTKNKPSPVAVVQPEHVLPSTSGDVAIAVTEAGFEPAGITVKAGQPTTLVFTRKTEKTCATEVVIPIDPANPIRKELPLDQAVPVTVTFPKAGQIRYACGMDMVSGVVTVQ